EPRALEQRVLGAHGAQLFGKEQGYHVGLAMRTRQKGDKEGDSNSNALAKAITQVSKGVNGLVNTLAPLAPPFQTSPDGASPVLSIIPVIFTTAELWTTETALDATDLATGHLTPGQIPMIRRDYLAYHH